MRLISRSNGALRGHARAPGDKSISHRSLILGALAEGRTEIRGLLEGADVLATARAMQAYGADVERLGAGCWRVLGRGADGLLEPAQPIDFGNSGTGVRLTMGAAGAYPILSVFTGDASLSRRPMARVLDPLEAMGLRTLAREGGRLPAAVKGPPLLNPLVYRQPVASAQVKSALLLAGLRAQGLTQVIEPKRSRDHTERMLAAFGADVVSGEADGGWSAAVKGPVKLTGQSTIIPSDPSSAAFAAVAAAILPGSEVRLEGVCLNPLRTGLYVTLLEMGADLAFENERLEGGEPVGDLVVRGASGLAAVAPPAGRAPDMIDEFPILAVAAAFAEGETRLSGAEELRVKESDRIALTVAGLRACGVEAEERPDGLLIQGCGQRGVPGGGEITTHGDHRIAMAFLVLGLAARAPVCVHDGDMIATSFPDFPGFMAALGGQVREVE